MRIATESDYQLALGQALALSDAVAGSAAMAEFNELVEAIEAYEDLVEPLPEPTSEALHQHLLEAAQTISGFTSRKSG